MTVHFEEDWRVRLTPVVPASRAITKRTTLTRRTSRPVVFSLAFLALFVPVLFAFYPGGF